jgi:hypothetical protein
MNSFLDDLLDEKTANKWIQQGSLEWDQIRIGRFTASEIWKLTVEPREKSKKFSDTTLGYIQEKVAEVLTGQTKQQGYAFPLVWGTEKEPEAIEKFIESSGFAYERVGFFPFTDHAGGSPDGFINDNAIIEVKSPYDSGKQIDYLMLTDQWDLKRYSREYYYQCQANILFTGRELCYFVTYDPRMQNPKHILTQLEVKADEEAHQLLVEKIAMAVEEKLKLINLLQ